MLLAFPAVTLFPVCDFKYTVPFKKVLLHRTCILQSWCFPGKELLRPFGFSPQHKCSGEPGFPADKLGKDLSTLGHVPSPRGIWLPLCSERVLAYSVCPEQSRFSVAVPK